MEIINYLKHILQSKEIRVLIENFFSLSALQVVGYVLPLITLPYLVRVLGVEKYGLVAFATSFAAYFLILTDYGFNLSANREISINRNDKQQVSQIFSAVMIIKALLLLVSFTLLITIVLSFDKFTSNWQVYIFAFGMVVGNVLFPVWFFQGMEKMKYSTSLNIIAQVIFTIAIFIFIRGEVDFLYVPIINSFGFIVAGILSLLLIFRNFEVKFVIPESDYLWETFKDSTQFFLSRASVSIFTSSNIFFLGLFTNNIFVGYYSAAEKLFGAAQGIYTPLTQTLYPFMSHKKNKAFFKKIFKLSVSINVIFCIVLFVMSGFIINLLFGSNFQESANVLKIFSIALLIVTPAQLLGYPYLAALGYPKYANVSVVLGSVFHLIMLLILVMTLDLNIYSVASLVCITNFIVLLIRLYGVNKHKLWW
ncbi:MAG: flippase [Methanobacterium sp.]|jgi:PST family polysaccharide transporter